LLLKKLWCRFWCRFFKICYFNDEGTKPCRERYFAKNEEFLKNTLAQTSGGSAITSMAESAAKRWVVAATP
jgi:hypothetical protein